MIPKDPMMLLSYLNTQLRDHYENLEVLCNALDLEKTEILDKMSSIDYVYDQKVNQFV